MSEKKRKRRLRREPLALEQPEIGSASPAEERDNRNKMRALIVGALAAGGVFQINNWQTQAHGNRSSHSATTVQNLYISPDDYVLLRETLTAPNLSETSELAQLTAQLHSLQQRGAAVTQTSEFQRLSANKTALEKKIGTPKSARQVLQFLSQGDVDGAIAAIEGEGWTERVLGQYMITLLDIAYLDGRDNQLSPARQKNFVTIAKPAFAYSEKVLGAVKGPRLTLQETASKERVAEILHNIASFIVLMNSIDDSEVRLGQTAAELALKTRIELKQPREIMRAHWMVAQYHIRANRTEQALGSLRTALRQAETLKDTPGIAWAKFSMSKALKQSRPQRAMALEAETRALVKAFQGKDTTIDFLRLELR